MAPQTCHPHTHSHSLAHNISRIKNWILITRDYYRPHSKKPASPTRAIWSLQFPITQGSITRLHVYIYRAPVAHGRTLSGSGARRLTDEGRVIAYVRVRLRDKGMWELSEGDFGGEEERDRCCWIFRWEMGLRNWESESVKRWSVWLVGNSILPVLG